jgi:hypothetical protein
MKFTITIDCHDDGKLSVWSQEKENMTSAQKQQKEELLREVKRLAAEKNAEIVHHPKSVETEPF